MSESAERAVLNYLDLEAGVDYEDEEMDQEIEQELSMSCLFYS